MRRAPQHATARRAPRLGQVGRAPACARHPHAFLEHRHDVDDLGRLFVVCRHFLDLDDVTSGVAFRFGELEQRAGVLVFEQL